MPSDTEAVTESSRFGVDKRRLVEYLVREEILDNKSDGCDEAAIDVRKFSRGQSNPTFLIKRNGKNEAFVIRAKPKGKLIRGAHRIDREYRIIKTLGSDAVNFPVPRVRAYCTDTNVLGSEFYVMDFCEGSIETNNLGSVPPHRRREYLKTVCKTLAHLHSVDPFAVGLLGTKNPYGKNGGFYPRQLRTMQRLNASQTKASGGKIETMRSFEELVRLLSASLPDDVVTIVHGDYKPDNIIMDKDKCAVRAVLDWELSTIGHPLSDLANLCLPYYITAELSQVYPSFSLMPPDSGVPSQAEVHRWYCDCVPPSVATFPIKNWEFFIAFACLRLSIIMQGIGLRVLKGQASSAAARVDMVVFASEAMCDLGLDVIRKKTTARL